MNGGAAGREAERARMVESQLRARGIRDPRVLDAMGRIPREEFAPPGLAADAYADRALPLAADATLSQPYIVAYMTERLHLLGPEKVLEIGTGAGYQAAVLAGVAARVCSVEIDESLLVDAGRRLARLGLANVSLKVGDGLQGWAEEAPFDRILLTCAVEAWPPALKEQLRPGGWLLAPVGPEGGQTLKQLLRLPEGWQETSWIPVSFVAAKRRQ